MAHPGAQLPKISPIRPGFPPAEVEDIAPSRQLPGRERDQQTQPPLANRCLLLSAFYTLELPPK